MGSDKEVKSDFQLIAGTNCDLATEMRAGRFRDDLLARINLWTFRLPALRERREDIEPNLDYELEQFASIHGRQVTFNKEAREKFIAFATAADSIWSGNFRDLNAAVLRMATLSAGGRIGVEIVAQEIDRLRTSWSGTSNQTETMDLDSVCDNEVLAGLDPFDRVQLVEAIRVCQQSRSLSDAGRKLFAASRTKKGTANDADRLRKYLARFGLNWAALLADE